MNKNNENIKEYGFQTEVESLLNILAHSLYSNPEIFLRELISNSADSLSKVKFLSLTDKEILHADEELKIVISLDEKEKTFSIYDNGLGMNEKELKENLGTIAKSGTVSYLKEAAEKKEKIDLIGKFGVGFYSVFMVTNLVEVVSKSRLGGKGKKWESSGKGTFTISDADEAQIGTKISFKFNESAQDLANLWRIKQVVTEHSNFVPFKIEINGEKANQLEALWVKNKSAVKAEEYKNLFDYLSHENTEPFLTYHYNSDAPLQFHTVLFVAEKMPPSFMNKQLNSRLQLYSKKIFIQDNCEELNPNWLRFIYGIVDSYDLPLNISRQAIQSSPILQKIESFIVKKLIAEWQKLQTSDKEKFAKFWQEYGIFIKEGIYSDFTNKDELIKLFSATSSKSDEKLITLDQYVAGMAADQKEIYYVLGSNKTAIEASPQIEYFLTKNIEVLYLYDEIDDFVVGAINKFQDKLLTRIDRADIELNKDEKNADKKSIEIESKEKLLNYFKDILGDKVADIIDSNMLTKSPCMLVSKKGSPSLQSERILKMMNQDFSESKRVLALNFENPILINLAKIQKKRPQDEVLKDSINTLYDSCLFSEQQNGQIETAPRIYKLLLQLTEFKVNSFG